MHLRRAFHDARSLVRAARHAADGNVSMLFAFSIVPVVGLVGLGVDYGVALSTKSKLDTAADAAAIAAVATAKAYVANNPNDANVTQNAINAGIDRASRAFKINAGSISLSTVPTPTITLNRSNQTFSSSVTYGTTTTTQFAALFGQSGMNVNGLSKALADIPSYLDFYLMVDVSGSMGLPSTSAGQTQMMNLNGGCQFACHFPSSANGGDGYYIATTGKKANGTVVSSSTIQLRSGAVNNAVCMLLQKAASPTVPNQYRVGLYPFINQVSTLAAITSDIATVKSQADCNATIPMTFTKMLDTDTTQLYSGNDPSTGTGSGGTHFDLAFPGMQSAIATFGDGSAATKPRPFVFLITDGMDNNQHFSYKVNTTYNYVGSPNTLFQSNFSGKTSSWDGSQPKLIDSTWCTSLKNAGATLSILYIPYVTLTVGSSNQGETNTVNSLIPQLPATLTKCASSGFFYTANTPDDITSALGAMFAQAVQVAHLSK